MNICHAVIQSHKSLCRIELSIGPILRYIYNNKCMVLTNPDILRHEVVFPFHCIYHILIPHHGIWGSFVCILDNHNTVRGNHTHHPTIEMRKMYSVNHIANMAVVILIEAFLIQSLSTCIGHYNFNFPIFPREVSYCSYILPFLCFHTT